MAVGISVIVDDDLIKKMETADGLIKKLADDSEATRDRMIAAFKSMGDNGVQYLINKLKEAQTALNNLSSNGVDVNVKGIDNISTQATKSVDNVNKLYEVMLKLVEINDRLSTQKQSPIINESNSTQKFDISKLINQYNELTNKIKDSEGELNKLLESTKAFEQLKSKLQSGGSGVITKQQMEEYQANLKNIELLKEQIEILKNKESYLQNSIARQKELNALAQGDSDSATILKQMKEYYQEEEKAARARQQNIDKEAKAKAQASKEAERNAAKEAKERERNAKAADREAKAQAKLNEQKAKEETFKRNTSFDGSLEYSKTTKTINEQIQAIKYLKIARANLSKEGLTDEAYRKKLSQITDEIKRQEKEVSSLLGQNTSVAQSQRNLMDVSGQLARKLALVFSVSQIQGYISNLVKVRGEFELQQKSLQVLLQNRDEANKLWQQTVELAVKSPFRVGELVSYTRQLAAYRIETSKLHETTRKLADVSAGLGVDMNRLILAYGQVRAAEYLRGTELRQFTEAGIPMLDELAKRFTELEGRVVSAGDVFERISKRMVTFADVAAVFDKMTSAGGTFYKMQEEQSTTLKGMISNLRDTVDLMMNDIGKSNEWILKGSVNAVRGLVENWENLTYVLKTIITLIAIYRIGLLKASVANVELARNMGMTNIAAGSQLKLTELLRLGWLRVGKSVKNVAMIFKANLPLMGLTIAIAGLLEWISTWNEHKRQLEELSKEYEKLRRQANEITYGFKVAVDNKDYSEQREKLQSLIDLANNQYHMNIKIDIQGLKEDEIREKFNSLRQQLAQANAFALEFQKRMNEATNWTLQDDIYEDLKQLDNAASELNTKLLNNLSSAFLALDANYSKLNEKQLKAYETLKTPRQENESELEYLIRMREAYEDIYESYFALVKKRDSIQDRTSSEYRATIMQLNIMRTAIEQTGVDIGGITDGFANMDSAIKEARKEYNDFVKDNKDFLDKIRNLPADQQTFLLQIAIDKVGAEKDWGDFEKEYIQRWLEKDFPIHFSVVPPEKKPLEEWQDRYNEKFKDYEGFQILNADSTREKVLQRINGLLSTQKKLVDAITKAGTKDSAYVGMSLENEQKKLRQLEAQRDFFGGDTKNGEKGKDWYSELANNIKAAHKEFVSLNKDLSTTEAASLMIKRYTGVIHESLAAIQKEIPNFDISQYDLTNEDSTIKALSDLFNMLPESAKAAKLNVQKALSDIIGEQTINNAKVQTTQLINEIKDMIDGYKLSIELEKLDIPQNLAEDLFDVKTFNLDDIKARIAAEKAADKEISKERLKQLEQLERQVADLEDNARMEKLKKYTKYLLQAQSETVKIKLDEVKQIAEIESLNMTPDQKAIAKQAVREETQKKLDKQQWEDFKNTDMYIELFEELDNVSTKTLENMKAKLVEMRKSLNNLDPTRLKDITKRIDDVNKELVTRNPFKNIAQSIKGVISGYKKYQETAEAAMTSQVEVDRQQAIVDDLAVQVELQKKKLDTNQKGEKLTWEEYTAELSNHALLTGNLKIATDKLNTLKKINEERQKENKEAKQTFVLSKETLQATASQLGEQLSAINDIKDAWSGVFGGMSASLSDAFDSMQEIGGGVINIMEGMAKGPAGYLQAAAGLMQTIGGIFNIGDKKKERQIQREIDKVEDLQHAYEKLEKEINDAYAIDTLELTTKNAKSNLQKQIDGYNSMIAAEEAKKKTDKDRIKEWQYAIENLQEQIKELDKQAFSQATNGIVDDVLSAANEFTDAWLSAFNEVGNGLSGLKDNFQEMMLNMVKQQASMLITQQYVNNWKKELERYISADDLELTTDEAKRWVASVTNSLPQLNDALTAYFEAMKAAGVDLTGGDSNLSGLARSIQGITDEQADILASYANSCRFFLANIDTTLTSVANQILGDKNMPNPILSELKTQTELVRGISTLLNSLTSGGHSMGGRGLRVFIS